MTEAAHILVIEDNDPVRTFIARTLEEDGFAVEQAPDCSVAFSKLRHDCYDLVLLDLKLGDGDGMDILKTIRRQDETLPVIIVSSLQDINTKVGGFEIGCDDYITKPFQAAELIWRIRRLLRRSSRQGCRDLIHQQLRAGPFFLDIKEVCAYRDGKPLRMRRKLFDILLFMAQNPDVVLTKEAIHERVWDSREDLNENSLYVHIHQLRTIIEDNPSHPKYLKTVRGLGFSFHPQG
ncbi:two-component system, OmpR family, alkaline phosphatase synthesis response regulator PhoP/two-component system, OmpR family, response regulator RegX3 [Alkalispirochaeta americana]|uniref:Two-component system, OmpR family, alkaline phosphatase synthesis response regulator PhoP/two-component system, OmpR family, response regulator RegX3 n=1 Tax=Alkalispirochaeta americana TaxID=159291 RepID=A0A1N6PWB9_9SPIO|nr:response regulator transcription factor [Alkalispirochaeta americana]SIQ08664.1 two-component system, OmpR family, alkaline phosphatase synthesis response regulator PhoP/two-component system, OmpR family, response regulator RegX3 [Alkalispirochaeta americana]